LVVPEVEIQATLPAIQKWYTQKTKNYDKSTTEAIFMPQWGEGLLHTLNDGTRLAVFPVWREANIQYYELGFVRRLVVKLNADNQVIGGEILEMISSKSYLKAQKNNIPQWYYEKTLKNEDALVYTYEVNPNDIKSNKSAACSKPGEWYVRWVQSSCSYELIYVGGCSRVEVVYQIYPSICGSDGGAGGGGGFIGTGGGDSPNPIYGLGSDPTGGIDAGENLNPPTTTNVKADTSITNNARLKCIYDKIADNTVFKDIAKIFSPNGITVIVKKGTTKDNTNGQCDSRELATKKLITITLNKDRVGEERWAIEIARTIIHELLHAKFLTELYKVGGYQKLTEANNKELYDAYKNFPGTTDDPHSLPQHNLMSTDKYLDIIATAIKEYDTRNANNPEATFDWYKAMAWGGLKEQSVRYQNMKKEDKDAISLNLLNLQSITTRTCQ
jgi:hypothetical protein